MSLSRPSTPSYQASNEHVGQQLQQALSLQGSASPLRGVATEYLTPEQAQAYGIVDKVLRSEDELPTKPTFLSAL